jgi:Domain of Unknown Function (DUF1206)
MVGLSTQRAKNNRVVQGLGRAGMACYGLVHIIVAYLALQVAFGESEKADQNGAIQEIGSTSFGAVVLWVLTVGLIAFGIWQFMQAAIGFHWVEKKGKRTRKRIGAVVRGVVGISLGLYAGRLVTGSGGGGRQSGQQQQEWTAKLMSLPAGQVLVGIAALVVIGVGIAQVVKGFKQSFVKDLDLGDLPSGTQQWVRRLGTAGYIAKGVVFGIVGVLVGFAALDENPQEAGGLDRALKTLAAQPFGTVALVVVAIGLAAFGVYCFAAARAHKA